MTKKGWDIFKLFLFVIWCSTNLLAGFLVRQDEAREKRGKRI